jgi:hypothetical protein
MVALLEEAERVWGKTVDVEDHMYGQFYYTYFAYRLEEMKRGKEAGLLWQTIGLSQEFQNRTDREAAFGSAVEMMSFKDSEDTDEHLFVVWLWGNGLMQMTDDRLTRYLEPFLESEKGAVVLDKLNRFVDYKVPYQNIETKHELGVIPECFLKFVSVLLISKLDNHGNEIIGQLKEKANTAMKDPEFQRIVGLYGTITDTREFAKQLQAKIGEVLKSFQQTNKFINPLF